jgi:hypothetical protein
VSYWLITAKNSGFAVGAMFARHHASDRKEAANIEHLTSNAEHRTLNIELLNRLLLVERWMFGVRRSAFASTA